MKVTVKGISEAFLKISGFSKAVLVPENKGVLQFTAYWTGSGLGVAVGGRVLFDKNIKKSHWFCCFELTFKTTASFKLFPHLQ